MKVIRILLILGLFLVSIMVTMPDGASASSISQYATAIVDDTSPPVPVVSGYCAATVPEELTSATNTASQGAIFSHFQKIDLKHYEKFLMVVQNHDIVLRKNTFKQNFACIYQHRT